MATTPPPLGYSTPLVPESRDETYQSQVADKAISLTKSAIQQYIDSFLNPGGENRSYLGATLSPEGLQYVTELTFDDEMKVDPNKRKTYLARFFAENTGRLPSILIIDNGVEDFRQGISALEEGFSFRNRWHAKLLYLTKVSLSILVATYSEEDTTTLSGALFYIFVTLSNIINSRVIRTPGSSWEVRLPISGITAGQMSNIPVEGDTKTQIWMRTIEIACDFETISTLTAPLPNVVLPPVPLFSQPSGGPIPRVLNLAPNQGVSLGSSYQLFIEGMQVKHSLGTSDPSVALITGQPPWLLQPRRQGKALLYVFDDSLPEGQDLSTGRKKNLLFDIPFKVTL